MLKVVVESLPKLAYILILELFITFDLERPSCARQSLGRVLSTDVMLQNLKGPGSKRMALSFDAEV